MAESPDGTTIENPSDRPIVDWAGVVWRLTTSRQVTANGRLDREIDCVEALQYWRGHICARTKDRGWWAKRAPSDAWVLLSNGPPDCRNKQVLAAISKLSAQADKGFAVIADALHALIVALTEGPAPDVTPASVRFVVPTAIHLQTKEPVHMPINISDDVITVIPLEFDNRAGGAVPPPTGGNASVTISNTDNFSVELSDDGMSVRVIPAQPPTDGATGDLTYTDTLADGTVLTATLTGLTISADPRAVSVHFNTTNVTELPLTSAPGVGAAGATQSPAAGGTQAAPGGNLPEQDQTVAGGDPSAAGGGASAPTA